MWSFKSKKIETLQLPPLPSNFDNEDVSLLPEEIPEEIPPLEELKPSQQASPDTEESVMPEIKMPSHPADIAKKGKLVIPKSEKFIIMDKYKEILTQLVSTNDELNNVDSEF